MRFKTLFYNSDWQTSESNIFLKKNFLSSKFFYKKNNLNDLKDVIKVSEDANKQSFKEIWNGKARRDKMNMLNPKEHCRFHCIRHSTNIELEKFVTDPENKITIEDYDRFL